MSRASYLDSSAIVKLVIAEPESGALRRYLRRRKPHITSALSGAEVARALLSLGPAAQRRGDAVLACIDAVRVSGTVLRAAAGLLPADLRTLDAIHLATAQQLGHDLARVITYDVRMQAAAQYLGLDVAAPG